MSHTARIAYWRECLEAALTDVESDPRFDPTLHGLPHWAFERAAESLATSAENESLALGHDAIPNPLTAEVEELRREVDAQQERAGRAERDLNDSETLRAQWERRARHAEAEIKERDWNRLLGR